MGLLSLIHPEVPAQTTRVYIAPDDHTDYYWTADETRYRRAFLDMIDYYLDLADATAGNPSPCQSRWNCDGSFWVWTYEKDKSAAEFERLISRIRSGHISMPLNALVSCYGGTPAEAVLRGMYYAGSIERRYNLRFPLAVAMENQTLPCGLAALWAGSGARHSWRGICGCVTRVPAAWDREHDIYWYEGPDGSRILMKWNSMLAGNKNMGGYAEARNPSATVEFVTSHTVSNGFADRYPFDVIGCFGKGWDDLQTRSDEFVTAAQAGTTAARQVIVSNEEDFFQDFEAAYGAVLPTESRAYGNEWDLYCASMAEATASVKRSVEQLRAAEALATLVSLKNPAFMSGRETARDLAWMDLGLYWEHNWVANGPVPRQVRQDWQRRLAAEIVSYVDALHSEAAAALGALIKKTGPNLRFYVFNPLSWTRTDYADLPYSGPLPIHVVDLAAGQETPSQIVTVDGEQRLRILAPGVPPVGYKVFEARPGAGADFGGAASAGPDWLENSHYRLAVAPRGAITSLTDKSRGDREFVRVIEGRAMNDLGPSASGSITFENAGPVTATLVASAPGPIPHTARITLIRDSERIEIRNDIDENFGFVATWGFGFELDGPDVWHEEVGALIRAKLQGAGGHYSPRNARYDWLTLNHFADISGAGVGATLSNWDCCFMQLGQSSVSTLDTATPQLSPLAGGQVDGTEYGIPNQGGDSHFLQRFALRTHDAYSPAEAMRFALEHQNPLVAGVVTGAGHDYPETSFSLLSISDPNVLLWSLKPADDGLESGIVVRVWNVSSAPSQFTLRFSLGPLASATRATHLETPLEAATLNGGALQSAIAQQQLLTFLLEPTAGVARVSGWEFLR